MQRRFQTAALVAVVAALSALVSSCGYMDTLEGRKAVKEAYSLYQQQDYKRAAERFEQAVTLNPNEKQAYFFLGNAYDNLYKPSRKGEAENDSYLQKAVQYYKKSAEVDPDTKMRKLALEYLVAAYGPDKLDDASQAEPLVKQMIELQPREPGNYYVLAKMYEDSGLYDDAEATLLKAREMRPDDSGVLMQLAGYYNRLGQFDQTMKYIQERAQKEPNNPEAHYTIASYYFDKQLRDSALKPADKMNMIKAGVEAVDKALSLNANYADALVYKGLLFRSQALLEKDSATAQRLVKEADALRDRAMELKKQKAAGVQAAAAPKK